MRVGGFGRRDSAIAGTVGVIGGAMLLVEKEGHGEPVFLETAQGTSSSLHSDIMSSLMCCLLEVVDIVKKKIQ